MANLPQKTTRVSKQDLAWSVALATNPEKARAIENKRKAIRIIFISLYILFGVGFLICCLCFDMMSIYYNQGQILLPGWWWDYGFSVILIMLYILATFCSKAVWNFAVWFINVVFLGVILMTAINKINNQIKLHVVDFATITNTSSADLGNSIKMLAVIVIVSALLAILASFIRKKIRKPEIKEINT